MPMRFRRLSEMRAKFLATIPLGRFARPSDVATALFLCSSQRRKAWWAGIGKPSSQREIGVREEGGQDTEAPSGLTAAEKGAIGLARCRAPDHISCMANETDLHLKITRGPPFWWEIYRGDDPQWVERSMFGYLIEKKLFKMAKPPFSTWSIAKRKPDGR
jgi:hypothetical protein